MELAVIKLFVYAFIGALGALFIYITAVAAFIYNKLERIKAESPAIGLATSDIKKIQLEFSKDVEGEVLMLKALRWLEKGLSREQAVRKVRLEEATVMLATQIDNY
jgi:hypothetical protein